MNAYLLADVGRQLTGSTVSTAMQGSLEKVQPEIVSVITAVLPVAFVIMLFRVGVRVVKSFVK